MAYEILADGLAPENFKKVEMSELDGFAGDRIGVKVRKTTLELDCTCGSYPWQEPD